MKTNCTKRILIGFLAASLYPQTNLAEDKPSPRPNFLFIITDQQQGSMMSCAGNQHVRTPNLDLLASQGIRFARAYAANPVCIPSRFSLMTGQMPSIINMEDNDDQKNFVSQKILDSALGRLFKKAGYETVYAGKMHLTGSSFENGYENPLAYGFSKYLTPSDHEGREQTVDACVDFLKKPKENPFLLIASLINPHDICYLPLMDWTNAEKQKNPFSNNKAVQLINEILKIPKGMSKDEFIEKYCPPLPNNFGIPNQELPSFTRVKENNYIGWSRRNYTEKDWRIYRYLYARLTEIVDHQIGQILDALKEAGLENNTMVVFTSDHGDQDASHRSGLKGYLYEESANIPLILKWGNVIQKNQIDQSHLVSNGLDLIPTLCDFAGISVPGKMLGMSLKPLALGNRNVSWREYLVVENNSARLLLFDKSWKYLVDTKSNDPNNKSVHEMLFNLNEDPGEMINLASDPSVKRHIREGRTLLSKWYSINNIEINKKFNHK